MEANWPVVGSFALLVLTVLVWREVVARRTAAGRSVYGWIAAAMILGAGLTSLGFFDDVLVHLGRPIPLRNLPTSRLKGWGDLGQRVSAAAATMGGGLFVLGDEYKVCAELGFYMDGQPHSYCLPQKRARNQYDIWGGTESLTGKNAIYIGRSREILSRSFERVESSEIVRKTAWGEPLETFALARCYRFKGWR